MPKRQRCDSDLLDHSSGRSRQIEICIADHNPAKRPQLSPDSTLRRSARLQKKQDSHIPRSHLPSPVPSTRQREEIQEEAKTTASENDHTAVKTQRKRRRTASNCLSRHPDSTSYWVFESGQLPPPNYFFTAASMPSKDSANKRTRDDSTTRTTRISERYARLEDCGISMDNTEKMGESGQRLCGELLPSVADSRAPRQYPCYQEQHRTQALRDAATCSEAIIQRDILPTVIPSVVNLRRLELEFFKDVELGPFIDEINAEWTRAATMGSTHPKPDYVAGLDRRAFEKETWDALMRYSNTETPILLSPDMCFPVLLGEAKRGSNGIQEALLQATHAAAIAVKSQISLHEAAYGKVHEKTIELYGQPLVFSILHNHEDVHILAHYALFEDDKPRFHYQKLEMLTLTLHGGRYRNIPNTFVENLYRRYIPLHLKRLRDVAKALQEKEKKTKEGIEKEKEEANQKGGQQQANSDAVSRASTGLSFGASQMGLDDGTSTNTGLEASQGEGSALFKKPSLPPSAKAAKELAQIRKMMEEQRVEFKHREEKLELRLEEQKVQMEQQRVDSKLREEKLEQQLARLTDLLMASRSSKD